MVGAIIAMLIAWVVLVALGLCKVTKIEEEE